MLPATPHTPWNTTPVNAVSYFQRCWLVTSLSLTCNAAISHYTQRLRLAVWQKSKQANTCSVAERELSAWICVALTYAFWMHGTKMFVVWLACTYTCKDESGRWILWLACRGGFRGVLGIWEKYRFIQGFMYYAYLRINWYACQEFIEQTCVEIRS